VASYGPIENLVSGMHGRVVLVAMNYRLGALGFATLKELADVDPRGVSGNLGFTDQQLALQWVGANAKAFGGDPSRVTLIGQSSGGTSILAHLAAPASRGLFHAAISLSASPNVSISRADKEAQDEARWFRRTPCANLTRGRAVLSCMRSASVAALQGALLPNYDYFDFDSSFPYEPVPPGKGIGGPPRDGRWSSLPYVDGVTITKGSVEAARDGYHAPLLLQNLEGELDYDPDAKLADLGASRAKVMELLEAKLSPGFGGEAAKKLAAMYAHVGGENETLAAAPAYALSADSGATCGSLTLARTASAARRSKGTAPVYLSFVTARPTHPLHAPYGETCTYPSIYAFHLWDWISAMSTGAPGGNATTRWPQGKCGVYVPSTADVALGRALLEQWATFAENARFPHPAGSPRRGSSGGIGRLGGAGSVGWRATDEAEGWPAQYVHGVIGASGETSSEVDYKRDACAVWHAASVGQEWWWIN
jgi:carboxylesterase type B